MGKMSFTVILPHKLVVTGLRSDEVFNNSTQNIYILVSGDVWLNGWELLLPMSIIRIIKKENSVCKLDTKYNAFY